MAKVKTIVRFRDKENNLQERSPGEEFDCTKERAAFLVQRGFVEEVKDTNKTKKTETAVK